MNRISYADAAVWRDYIDNLHTEAIAIRQRLAEGVLTPPSLTAPAVEDADIEQQHTEWFMTTPSGMPRAAERAEQKLVHRCRDYMAAKGVAGHPEEIPGRASPPDVLRPMGPRPARADRGEELR